MISSGLSIQSLKLARGWPFGGGAALLSESMAGTYIKIFGDNAPAFMR